MSEPLRVAAAVEGPTDAIVLRAVIDHLLERTEFEFQTLQPEGSAAFGSAPFGRTGVGWGLSLGTSVSDRGRWLGIGILGTVQP